MVHLGILIIQEWQLRLYGSNDQLEVDDVMRFLANTGVSLTEAESW
jgi:hypothetical protein